MLGAGQADAGGAERERVFGLLGVVGVGADFHAGGLGAPLHELVEGGELLGLLRAFVAVQHAGDDLARLGGELAAIDDAAGAVDREEVAFLEGLAGDGHGLRLVVDLQRAGAADADLAHLPGDERGVRGDAAFRGQDALGGDHAAQIFGRRFVADEQDFLALLGSRGGAVGVEIDLAGSRAGAGGEAAGDGLGLLHLGHVEDRREELVELIGGIAQHRGFPVDELLLVHIHGELQRGRGGALAVARLEHEELAFLHRELDVLHVLEVLLERRADLHQLRVRLRHLLLQLRTPAPACARRRPRLRPAR